MKKNRTLKQHISVLLVFALLAGSVQPVYAKNGASSAFLPEASSSLQQADMAPTPSEASPSAAARKTENGEPVQDQWQTVIETAYNGTVEISAVRPEGAENTEDLVLTAEEPDADEREQIDLILQKDRDLANNTGMILGDVSIRIRQETKPEGYAAPEAGDRTETLDYAVTLGRPENLEDVRVYRIIASEEGERAALLVSRTEPEEEKVLVCFSGPADGVYVLELTAGEEEHGYGLLPEEKEMEGTAEPAEPENSAAVQGKDSRLVPVTGEEFPEVYSSVAEGLVPAVRNQGSLGTCAYFAVTAVAEIGMVKKGYAAADEIDLSEAALTYYANHTVVDPLGLTEGDTINTASPGYKYGSNETTISTALSQWRGYTDEETVPYSWLGTSTGPEDERLISGGTDLCFNQNSIVLTDAAFMRSTEEQIKHTVLENGAAYISYSSVDTAYRMREGDCYYYFDGKMVANSSGGHAVTVVGWDDSIPASRFVRDPGRDGAWLIRNSWGENWGNAGYFWMSYASVRFPQMCSCEFVPAERYDYNYHYDGSRATFSFLLKQGERAANIFPVVGESAQKLEAVQFYSMSNDISSKVSVYVSNEKMEDPESGIRVTEQKAAFEHTGFHTIELETPVDLEPGGYFSVVVENTGDQAINLPVNTGTGTFTNYTESGQSFCCQKQDNGYIWSDLDKNNTHQGKTFRIKAFVSDSGKYLVESIRLDKDEYSLNKGESVQAVCIASPSDYQGQLDLKWASSDPSVAEVDGDGNLTGKSPGRCYVTCSYKDRLSDSAEIIVSVESATVTYDAKGGTPEPAAVTVKGGEKLTEPEEPAIDRFRFTGWYVDGDPERSWDFDTDTVQDDMMLCAGYEPVEGECTLYASSGTGALKAGTGWRFSDELPYMETDPEILKICYASEEEPLVLKGTELRRMSASDDGSVQLIDFYEDGVRNWYLIYCSEDRKLHMKNAPKFSGLSVRKILGLEQMATEEITSLSQMFANCSRLEKLDLSNLVFPAVQSVNNMVYGSSKLAAVDLSGGSFSVLTSMYGMFNGCSGLYSVNLSEAAFPKAVTLSNMFYNCTKLEEVNFNGVLMEKPKTMTRMFYGCNALKEIDLAVLDLSQVTSMAYLFYGCSSLRKVDFSDENLSALTDMRYVFYNCFDLEKVDFSGCGLKAVRQMTHAFSGCAKLQEVEMGKWGLSAVEDMSRMFMNCGALKKMDLSEVSLDSVKTMSNMFAGCSGLQTVNLEGVKTGALTNIEFLFNSCWSLKDLDLPSLDISKVTAAEGVFYCCSNLETVNMSGCDLSGLTELKSWFAGCNNLKEIRFTGANLSAISTFGLVFHTRASLEIVDFSGCDLSGMTDLTGAFLNVYGLKTVLFTGAKSGKITSTRQMFEKCDNLESVDLDGLDLSDVQDMSGMFYGCKMLNTLDLRNFTAGSGTNVSNFTYGCDHLESVILGENFHPSAVYLPLVTTNRRAVFGQDLTGKWYLYEEPFTVLTITEMCNAPAGTWHAVPPVQTIIFNFNDGKSAAKSREVLIGNSYGELPEPERTGYLFGGWFTAPEGGEQVDSDTVAGKVSTVQLYARWNPVHYTVSFNANGGAGTMEPLTGIVYDTPETLTANAFKKTGYTFAGWALSGTGSAEYKDRASIKNLTDADGGTVTLYAVWTINQYTVRFDSNGGSKVASITQEYDTAIIKPKNPVRTGYMFAGWSPAVPEKMPAEDLTLKANWTANKYTIKFNANGGTGTMKDLAGVAYGTTKTLTTNAFKRTGYTFAGWSTSKSGSVKYKNKASVKNLSSTNGATVTLYAVWTVNKYTIKFNANGGTGTMKSLTGVAYGTAKTLASNTFKRTGYTFAGWSTKKTGKVKYKNKASVKSLSSTNGATVTLYAVWTKTKYKVTYQLNGGKNSSKNPASYYVTTSTITLKAPTRKGYTFAGWYSDSKCTKKVTSIKKGSTGNKTLYAKWKKK